MFSLVKLTRSRVSHSPAGEPGAVKIPIDDRLAISAMGTAGKHSAYSHLATYERLFRERVRDTGIRRWAGMDEMELVDRPRRITLR